MAKPIQQSQVGLAICATCVWVVTQRHGEEANSDILDIAAIQWIMGTEMW